MRRKQFKTFASIMIAVVTILGAIAACRATFASSNAGDADFEGMTAAIAAEKTSLTNQIQAYEHYRAFTLYRQYLSMYNLLSDEFDQTDDVQLQNTILNQTHEVGALIGNLWHYFFSQEYLDENNQYSIDRELNREWAEAAQWQDLNPQPHFDKADLLRRSALSLTADMIVFALAFWFFTLAQIIENNFKYVMAAGGFLLTLGALVLMVFAEVLTW